MTISDWVLIFTTLFLGVIALLTPLFAEIIKRKFFAPKMVISFERASPYCIKTYFGPSSFEDLNTVDKQPVYFFRIQVINSGKSQLKNCEAVIEELWIYDAAGIPQKQQGFSDINLRWAGSDSRFIDINPDRQAYCDIGYIASAFTQEKIEAKLFVDVPGKHEENLRFLFDQFQYPFSQPNCLLPGKYSIKISLFSENVPRKSIFFEIAWSGKWQETENDMFRELSIRQIGNKILL